MKLVLQRDVKLPSAAITNVGHVAIYSNDDALLAVMWERDDGTTALTRAGEPDFERLCSDMFLSKRQVVREIRVTS